MKQQELLDEAQVRELELDNEDKTHLVNILIIDDEAYVRLMEVLGCRFKAVDFAQGEVKLYNPEMKRKRAERGQHSSTLYSISTRRSELRA